MGKYTKIGKKAFGKKTLIPTKTGTDLFNPDRTLNAHVRLETPDEIQIDLFDATIKDPDEAWIDGEIFPYTDKGVKEASQWLKDNDINVQIIKK